MGGTGCCASGKEDKNYTRKMEKKYKKQISAYASFQKPEINRNIKSENKEKTIHQLLYINKSSSDLSNLKKEIESQQISSDVQTEGVWNKTFVRNDK